MTEKQLSNEEIQSLFVDEMTSKIPLGEDLTDDEKDMLLFARLLVWGV